MGYFYKIYIDSKNISIIGANVLSKVLIFRSKSVVYTLNKNSAISQPRKAPTVAIVKL